MMTMHDPGIRGVCLIRSKIINIKTVYIYILIFVFYFSNRNKH